MKPCARCGELHDRRRSRGGFDAFCRKCHNAYVREWRPKYSELSDEARDRANARSKAKMSLRYGKIKREPCTVCGSPKSQMHHPDYTKPREVVWVCVVHHRELHRRGRS